MKPIAHKMGKTRPVRVPAAADAVDAETAVAAVDPLAADVAVAAAAAAG